MYKRTLRFVETVKVIDITVCRNRRSICIFLLFTASTKRRTFFLSTVCRSRKKWKKCKCFYATNCRTFFFCSAVCTNRRTVANFFSSAVCTNRRTVQKKFSSAVCTNRRTEKKFLLFYGLYKPQKRKFELPTVSTNRRTVWQWKKNWTTTVLRHQSTTTTSTI